MQKDLTRARAKGISITFRVSQFQEIACDIHSHLAREVKINVKQILPCSLDIQPPWRNGVACWTSNSKVVGSSPTGFGIFTF